MSYYSIGRYRSRHVCIQARAVQERLRRLGRPQRVMMDLIINSGIKRIYGALMSRLGVLSLSSRGVYIYRVPCGRKPTSFPIQHNPQCLLNSEWGTQGPVAFTRPKEGRIVRRPTREETLWACPRHQRTRCLMRGHVNIVLYSCLRTE